MSALRLEVVVLGRVVLAAGTGRLHTADAIGIAGGRVVAAGSREDLLRIAGPRTERIDAGSSAVVPGLHDFHLHLVGMARARRLVNLAGERSMDGLVGRVRDAARATPAGEWVRGDGWWTEALDRSALHRLEEVMDGRPAFLQSHDHHSAWASRTALRLAGVDEDPSDPAGGRFERGPDGRPNGLLRERAADLVGVHAGRLEGRRLAAALEEVVGELLALGCTSVTDAGDPTDANGTGPHAALGDSFSHLAQASPLLEGRVRVSLDVPAVAIGAARGLGLRTGDPFAGSRTMRVGWAKVYADGALGSRTAAVFTPYRCPADGVAAATDAVQADTGILRLTPDELGAIVREARRARIGLAIHAIGDRAAATVLDALDSGPQRAAASPPDRIEHLQLLRAADRRRLRSLDVTASVQPTHCPSDRDTAERCWPDRLEDAYPWASLVADGVRLAFGSDAPIEAANPWLAIHAAIHRRLPGDPSSDWRPTEAVGLETALAASTIWPAEAAGRSDLGHLRPGAAADLAILSCDLDTLVAADERLAGVRSELTMVGGTVVHRA